MSPASSTLIEVAAILKTIPQEAQALREALRDQGILARRSNIESERKLGAIAKLLGTKDNLPDMGEALDALIAEAQSTCRRP
jgi:hypothetical protein